MGSRSSSLFLCRKQKGGNDNTVTVPALLFQFIVENVAIFSCTGICGNDDPEECAAHTFRFHLERRMCQSSHKLCISRVCLRREAKI